MRSSERRDFSLFRGLAAAPGVGKLGVMHTNMNAKSKCAALSLIALSFILSSLVIVFVAGVWNTPFSVTDSAGRAMGFNDRFSPEHYASALSGFIIQSLFNFDYAYSWLLLGMHGWGAWLILG